MAWSEAEIYGLHTATHSRRRVCVNVALAGEGGLPNVLHRVPYDASTSAAAIDRGERFRPKDDPALALMRDVARAIADGDLERRASLDAPGELADLALSLRELSVQLAARDAARHADEALLVQLTESLNEGVFGVDSTRHVIRINETGRRLLGVHQRGKPANPNA